MKHLDAAVSEAVTMTTTTTVRLEDSYRYCRDVTRSEARNFYFTFWLLPPRRRAAIFAVYTFSRRLDDIVDGAAPGDGKKAAREKLDYMRRLLCDPPVDDLLAPALRDAIEAFQIPREPFEELIEGMVMDLEGTSYRTFEDLERYCYRAASTVGLICIEIFGHVGEPGDERVCRPAIELGVAMQLTNILRDIREDLERGRVYLPADELDRFGVSIESLQAGRVDEPFRQLMRFQIQRARDYFDRAEALFPLLRAESRYCPVLLKKFYSGILDRIEATDYDVFSSRVRLGVLRKATLAGSFWVRSALERLTRPQASSR